MKSPIKSFAFQYKIQIFATNKLTRLDYRWDFIGSLVTPLVILCPRGELNNQMLIENAFLKLPELMLSSYTHRGNVEAIVVHHLATGLQMELNSRTVPFAYNHITVEKPYPKQSRAGTVFRADMLFESGGSVPSVARLDQYGFKDKQWLEVKSFFSKGRTSPATTQNIGRVVKDAIRLCLLPQELQGCIRQNGRYILLVFDNRPAKYLAYSDRAWFGGSLRNEHHQSVLT